MFIGHYGPSFVAKRAEPTTPLWLLFVAVQLLDVLWGIFVLLGIEKVRIVPGFTKTNALDLYYMPYTHSLPGALAWAFLAGIAYLLMTGSRRGAFFLGAAVFSHWPLDLIVHRPDLALYDNAAKVGFGLWDRPWLTLGVEGALVLGGLAIYMAHTRALKSSARHAMPVSVAMALGLQTAMAFSPPPPSDRAMAFTALAAYALLAALMAWLEKGRAAKVGLHGGV
jgi:hypothetical protein